MTIMTKKINKDDRNKLIGWLVLGAIYIWNIEAGARLTEDDLENYSGETCAKIIQMLDQDTPMDGHWSDLQCVIGTEVRKLF